MTLTVITVNAEYADRKQTGDTKNGQRGKRRKERLKVKLDDGAFIPKRAHDADAGYDLFATESQTVPAHGSAVFDTGVHMEIPYGYAGVIKSK